MNAEEEEEHSDLQDEEDIYENLPSYQQYDVKFEQLEKSNETLRCQLQHLESKVEELTKTNKKLGKMERALSRNISVLFATALTEVEHKDKMITELRRELDSLIFRRAQASEKSATATTSVSVAVADKVADLPAIKENPFLLLDPRQRPSNARDRLGENNKNADKHKVSTVPQQSVLGNSVVTRRGSHTSSKEQGEGTNFVRTSSEQHITDPKATSKENLSSKMPESSKTSNLRRKSPTVQQRNQRLSEESGAKITKTVCTGTDIIASSLPALPKEESKNHSKEVYNDKVNLGIAPVIRSKASTKEYPSNLPNSQGTVKKVDSIHDGKNNCNSIANPKLLELSSPSKNTEKLSSANEPMTEVGTTDVTANTIHDVNAAAMSPNKTTSASVQTNTAGDNCTSATLESSTSIDPEPVSLLRQALSTPATKISPTEEAPPQKFRIPKVKSKVVVQEPSVSVLERTEVDNVPVVERRYGKSRSQSPPSKEDEANSSVNVSISSSTDCEFSVRRKSRVKIVSITQSDSEQTQVTKSKSSIDVSAETGKKALCCEKEEENFISKDSCKTREPADTSDREDNSHVVHSGSNSKNKTNVEEKKSAQHTFSEKVPQPRSDSQEIIHEKASDGSPDMQQHRENKDSSSKSAHREARDSSSKMKHSRHKDSFTEVEIARHEDACSGRKQRQKKVSSPDVRHRVLRDFSPDGKQRVHRDNSSDRKQRMLRDFSPDGKQRVHRDNSSDMIHKRHKESSPSLRYREASSLDAKHKETRTRSPDMRHREQRRNSAERKLGRHRDNSSEVNYGGHNRIKHRGQRDSSSDLKHKRHRDSSPEVRHNEQRSDSPNFKHRGRRDIHEGECRSRSRDSSLDQRHCSKSRSEDGKWHSLSEHRHRRRVEEDRKSPDERRTIERNTRLRRSPSFERGLSDHSDPSRPPRRRRRSPSYEERRELHRDEKRPRISDSIERDFSEKKYRMREALKRLEDEEQLSSHYRHRSMSPEEERHYRTPPNYRKSSRDRESYARKQKEYSSKLIQKKLDDSEKRPSQQSRTPFYEDPSYPERGLWNDRLSRPGSSQQGIVDLRDKLKTKKIQLTETLPQREKKRVGSYESRDYPSQDEHSSGEYQNYRDLKKKNVRRRSHSEELQERVRKSSVSEFQLHPESDILDSEDDRLAKDCSPPGPNNQPETEISETINAITVKRRKLPPKLESTEFYGSVVSVQPIPAKGSSESENSLEDAMGEPKRYFINSMQDHASGENVTIMESQWRTKILHTLQEICRGQPPLEADGDGGLYVGVGGVAYMFYHLSQSDVLTDRRDELLCRGLEYAKAAVKYIEKQREDPGQKSALLLGDAGVHAVAAAIYLALGDSGQANTHIQAYATSASNCKAPNFLACGGDELFVGRAGYLLGLLWLQGLCKRPVLPQKDLFEICSTVVASGRNYAQKHRSPCPLMFSYYQVEYLGAAHGLCAILQALLSVPGFLNSSPEAERDVRTCVDWLLSLQGRAGNFPCATDELGARARPDEEQLVHWCHGAPGVVYLMAKAYLVWKDEKYLRSCLKCGELVWTKGLLKKGPGICHGVAGSGYVFLLLFRLTGDQRHLHRAQAFAHFLDSEQFLHGARSPDCPYSLYEGVAGTCCFLADLTQPQRAAFPLYDVF